MGKAIETIALQKNHEIVLKIGIENVEEFTIEAVQQAEVAIEFSSPESAFTNVMTCLQANVPVVCGSTGWLHHYNEAQQYCLQQNGALLYASNFSVGVNLFFELNKYLASLMNHHPEYEVSLEEIHHTQKKDAPSGTAITLAEQVLQQITTKKKWVNTKANQSNELSIISKRIDPAPGTHTIQYCSAIDDITITHTAHNRVGFASGAILAAEYLLDKKGIFRMKDVLGF